MRLLQTIFSDGYFDEDRIWDLSLERGSSGIVARLTVQNACPRGAVGSHCGALRTAHACLVPAETEVPETCFLLKCRRRSAASILHDKL